MKVFIAGATGVLGRRVVPLLAAGGHHVVGLSRSQANADWLTQHGAEARPGDLFDAAQMGDLAADCDAVLHLATAIPTKTRSGASDWALNDRIRRDGTRSLVEAALRGRPRLYVQQSIAFLYGDTGDAWVDERTPIVRQIGGILQSAVDMEQIVETATRERGLPATILRFGSFYCYDSAQTQAMLDAARRGMLPIIGDGGAYWSMINVDDAARAVVAALDHPDAATSRVFNVCDDEPVMYRDLVTYIAAALGARKPMRLPTLVARQVLGSPTVNTMQTSIRCRNDRIKATLGWQPQYPTYREGFQAEIEKWRA